MFKPGKHMRGRILLDFEQSRPLGFLYRLAEGLGFEPACRNNWHIHQATNAGGQMLICTAGEGWYQQEKEEAVSLKEGSIEYIPAEKKHWHGAKADSWFSHITIEIPGTECRNEWLEPVSDEDYNRL
jgi:quercetin dioxygenase-like cupin family protein